MTLELRDLRCFVAVAEEAHVTRAAERLGMDQPPLSLRIKALERKLGVQLFVRRPRGMELTEAGRTLLPEAQAVLARLEQSVRATQSVARGEQGQLRIALAPTAPFHPLVPQFVRGFGAAYPAVELTIGEGLSHEVRAQLLENQVDVAFVRVATMGDPALVVLPVIEEPLVAALPHDHPLARAARAPLRSLTALKDERFILFGPPGTGLHDATVEACAAAGFRPRLGQLAPRIGSTLGLVAAGMGVALVPQSMSRVAVEGVRYRAFTSSLRARAVLGVAWRARERSAVVRNFLAFVKEQTPRRLGSGTTLKL